MQEVRSSSAGQVGRKAANRRRGTSGEFGVIGLHGLFPRRKQPSQETFDFSGCLGIASDVGIDQSPVHVVVEAHQVGGKVTDAEVQAAHEFGNDCLGLEEVLAGRGEVLLLDRGLAKGREPDASRIEHDDELCRTRGFGCRTLVSLHALRNALAIEGSETGGQSFHVVTSWVRIGSGWNAWSALRLTWMR